MQKKGTFGGDAFICVVASCVFAPFEVGSHGRPCLGHLCEVTGTEGGGGEGGIRKKGRKEGMEGWQATAAGLVQGRGWGSERGMRDGPSEEGGLDGEGDGKSCNWVVGG